jgi:hypothetical protein
MHGIHTYNILRNPYYVHAFQYVSPYMENRNNLIKDGDNDDSNNAYQSDLVKMALNLAYMPLSMQQKFSFDKKSMDNLYEQ